MWFPGCCLPEGGRRYGSATRRPQILEIEVLQISDNYERISDRCYVDRAVERGRFGAKNRRAAVHRGSALMMILDHGAFVRRMADVRLYGCGVLMLATASMSCDGPEQQDHHHCQHVEEVADQLHDANLF